MALDMYETLVLLNEEDKNLIRKYWPRVMFFVMMLMALSLFTLPFIYVPVGDQMVSYTYVAFVVKTIEIGATSGAEIVSLVSAPGVMIVTLIIIFKELKEDRLIKPKTGLILSATTLVLYFVLTYFSNVANPFAIDRFILLLDNNFQVDSLQFVSYGAGYSAILIYISLAILFFNAEFISDILELERYKDRKIVADHARKVKFEKTAFFQNSDNARRYTTTIRNKSRAKDYEILVDEVRLD